MATTDNSMHFSGTLSGIKPFGGKHMRSECETQKLNYLYNLKGQDLRVRTTLEMST